MRKSRKKGSSHSTRPITSEVAAKVRLSEEEVVSLIIDYAKKGHKPSMIGMILRDQHGIALTKPLIGKKITELLSEKGLAPSTPEDLLNLIKKATRIRRHLEEHPKDFFSLRGLQLTESKIHRLAKYYKRRRLLPPDWRYEPSKMSLAS
ncbi:MAG: 30S ribosomal protein S15 [Candidatus Nezhaarchaeota archaeon]|nr:30S ribosomal protein S15 [Candidatus Nezhaarchaeota archaeon]